MVLTPFAGNVECEALMPCLPLHRSALHQTLLPLLTFEGDRRMNAVQTIGKP